MKQEVVDDDSIIYLDDLLRADIDKYITWVLNHKDITREEKKKSAISALGLREKTISNYRKVIQTEFIDTIYPKAPTDDERRNFLLWRKQSYEQEKRFGEIGLKGNPMPLDYIKEKELKRVCNLINRNYSLLFKDMFEPYYTTDFNNLALLAGKIDYLKYLHTSKEHTAGNINTAKSKLSLPEIGVLCYYNKRDVNIANDIDIAKEFEIITDRHTINKWFVKAEKNDFNPGVITGKVASAHIKRLVKIKNSGKLKSEAVPEIDKDIKALKTEI